MAAPPPLVSPSEQRSAKQELRRRLLALREELPAEVRASHSRRIGQRLTALPSFVAARTVLLFYPFGSEWTATLLLQEALRSGKTVVLPRVLRAADRSGQMVLHAVENIERDTAPGSLGIREPLPTCPVVAPEAIDWVLVPGVAFTPQGDRLGYGGGFYDRLLPQIPARAPRVAGAFAAQIVAELPTESHDCAVAMVCTENRVFLRTAPEKI